MATPHTWYDCPPWFIASLANRSTTLTKCSSYVRVAIAPFSIGSPFKGQGANQALRDAILVGRILCRARGILTKSDHHIDANEFIDEIIPRDLAWF